MDLSIVVPLLNEEESLPELCEWIKRVCTVNNYSYEVILVDDGSTDGSWQVIERLIASHRITYPSIVTIKWWNLNMPGTV